MTGVRLTTNAYPHDQRLQAWRFALQRVSLELESENEDIYGDLVSFTSGQKIQFVRCTGTAQAMTLDFGQEARCFWLVLLLEGRLAAQAGERTAEIGEGDMIYGGGDTRCRIAMEGDFRLLIVKVPHSLPALKSRSQLPTEISDLVADTAVGRMMSSLLRTVADTILDISDDQIRPVELALPEMIAATLLDRAPAKQPGRRGGRARGAILERVFQSIEMRLSDPNLNTHQIAAEHNISPRYLQKLFESHGESFGHYVKLRRLERCRLDLGSPLHAQRSISEILFQWGFNDSASFSRAFREQYGMSPREYRKSPESRAPPLKLRAGVAPKGPRRADGQPRAAQRADRPAQPRRRRAVAPPPLPARAARHDPLGLLQPLAATRPRSALGRLRDDRDAHPSRQRRCRAHDRGRRRAEAVFHWTAEGKAVERRGAGPFDASALGRGPGEGFGVHICTGPIAVEGARPGDVIEVRILDMENRPSQNPLFAGRAFGSNVAAYWGYHYNDLLTEPKQREVITIYEIDNEPGRATAQAVYSYRWTPQTDPSGVVHERYDYPGVPVDPETITRNFDVLRDVTIPVRRTSA